MTQPETTYTIHNADGTPRLKTDSANVAEAHSRIGLRVTARTEAAPEWRR